MDFLRITRVAFIVGSAAFAAGAGAQDASPVNESTPPGSASTSTTSGSADDDLSSILGVDAGDNLSPKSDAANKGAPDSQGEPQAASTSPKVQSDAKVPATIGSAATPDASETAASIPPPNEGKPIPAEAPVLGTSAPTPIQKSMETSQSQDSVALSHKPKSTVEEVVVTAQRREENAQDVPISITVFSGKEISNANITNSADLAIYTPSLSTNQRFGADNATFSIRGFTQELRTTASVATYMAEVVAPRGQSAQTSGDGAGPGTLFDLANVQVLKGPQGTLFGRNTTGGAVLLVPNKPGDDFDGYIEVSGGELNAMREQAVVNVPITEDFKVRLAVDRNSRDGHLRNVTQIGADKLGSVDYTSARFSTLWDVADGIQDYTILSYIDSKSTGYTATLSACNPNTTNNGFFLLFAGELTGQPCQAQLAAQKAAGHDKFYDVVSTIKSPETLIKEKRLINTLTWDINDDLKLKNILAYAHLRTDNGSDIFGTQFKYTLAGVPLDPLDPNREFKLGVSVPNPNFPVTRQATYVGELQLQGMSFDQAVDWQAGVYYETSRPDGFSGNNSAGLLSCEISTVEGDPSQYNCYDPLAGVVGGVITEAFKTTYLNRAVYGQSTWHINDEFSLTGGLRYTWDFTKGYGVKTRYTWALTVPQSPTVQITTPQTSSKAPTGLLEFDYKPFEGNMAYAKYLRGYRQGSVILAADPGIDTFKPEKVDTYELGIKTSFAGPFPGRFNLAIFHNDFTNQQLQLGYISPSASTTTTIVNAGKSKIDGIEGDGFIQLLDGLTLGLSFSLLDTKLLSQQDLTNRVAQAGGPIASFTVTPIANVGDELPYAPKQTYVTSLNWQLPVPENIGQIDFGITHSYIGHQRSAASSSGPFGMLDSFSLLNLNMTWTNIFNSSLDFVMFGTNVLNKEYVTYTSGTYNLTSFESHSVGQPRMIGGRLKYVFGNAPR